MYLMILSYWMGDRLLKIYWNLILFLFVELKEGEVKDVKVCRKEVIKIRVERSKRKGEK